MAARAGMEAVTMQWFTIAYTREGADRIHLETVEHPNEVEAWGYAVDMADTGC